MVDTQQLQDTAPEVQQTREEIPGFSSSPTLLSSVSIICNEQLNGYTYWVKGAWKCSSLRKDQGGDVRGKEQNWG